MVGESINQIKSYKNDSESFRLGKAVAKVAIAGAMGAASGYIGGDGARVNGGAYKNALDAREIVKSKVSKSTYSNPQSAVKILSKANNLVKGTGKETTIKTSFRFLAGTALGQTVMSWFD